MTENKINVEEIMQQIRAEIQENGYDASMLSFDDIPMPNGYTPVKIGPYNADSLAESVSYMNNNYSIDAWRALKSGKPVIGGLIVFCRKVIRKLIKFYVEPVTISQSAFNQNTVTSMNQVRNHIVESDKTLEEMQQKIAALTKEVETLKKELNDRH